MSSNPTQPKFGDQGEGVSFPPEDDAEGHRLLANADGDQPDGFNARLAEDDGRPEGFRSLADSEDDTEGHKYPFHADQPEGFVDGRPGGQPEAMEPVPSKDGFAARADADDTEGHRIVAYADGQPESGPEGVAVRSADGGDDDTEGHRIAASADADDTEGHRIALVSDAGEPQDGPEGARVVTADGEDDTEGHMHLRA